MIIQPKKNIDLLSGHQKLSFVALGEAFLRERNPKGEVVFEVLMWGYAFNEIMKLKTNFLELHSESVIRKFIWSRDYSMEDRWAEDEEAECERLFEFYNHLKELSLDIHPDYKNEYQAILEICDSALKNGNKLFIQADDY